MITFIETNYHSIVHDFHKYYIGDNMTTIDEYNDKQGSDQPPETITREELIDMGNRWKQASATFARINEYLRTIQGDQRES